MTIIKYIQGGILIALLATLGWYVWQNKSKAAKIDNLEAEKTSLQTSLNKAITTNESNRRLNEAEIKQWKRAVEVAEQELSDYKSRDRQLRTILDDLKQVPIEQRSPVSPIVCATIDRLYPDDPGPGCVDSGPTSISPN